MTAQIDYVECAYRLATAMYQVAEREAKGNFSHLYDDFTPDELWRKQQEAWAWCNEWREYFAQRLFGKVDPLPPPQAPEKRAAQGGHRAKIKGMPPIRVRAADWLREHGPATVREIAEALPCDPTRASEVVRQHPGLFRIVGERIDGPIRSTVWDIKRTDDPEQASG